MSEALNIPTKKNQFEAVPFVESMTQHQLKVMVKRLWVNLQDMASALDDNLPDLATMLDNLLDGCKVNPKTIRQRYQYFKVGEAILEYDSKNNVINVFDNTGNLLNKEYKGVTLTNIKKSLKIPLNGAQTSSK